MSEARTNLQKKKFHQKRRGPQGLFGLGLVSLHVSGLGINPATGHNRGNVLRRKVILFAVNDMFLHELVQLVKVEEGNHWVTMVFGMKVGVPQQDASDEVGTDRTSVAEAVGDLGNFAVGMFEVADIVDHGVSDKDRDDPPKEDRFQALTSLANGGRHRNVKAQLHQSRALKLLHNARFLGVIEFLEAPSSTRVVNSNAHGREDDTAGTALEGCENVEELHNVGVSARRKVAEARVLEGLTRVEASEFRILVNVVGEGMVLLVHDTFMFTKFKAEKTDKEQRPVVYPLGLPSIAVKELMLSGKGKALELKAVEKVERNKHGKLLGGQLFLLEREHIHLVDGIGRTGHDGKVDKEALESLKVRLLHESNEDPVIEQTVTLLAFTVLNIGPVFIVGIDARKARSVGLLVEDIRQHVVLFLFRGFLKEDGGHTGIRRHCVGGSKEEGQIQDFRSNVEAKL